MLPTLLQEPERSQNLREVAILAKFEVHEYGRCLLFGTILYDLTTFFGNPNENKHVLGGFP